MNNIEFIKEKVTTKQLLVHLSEELAELYQAYCKFTRANTGFPGTVISVADSREMVYEEMADVLLIWKVLEYQPAYLPKVDDDTFKKSLGFALMVLLSNVDDKMEPTHVTVQIAVCISKIYLWCFDNAFDKEKVEEIQSRKLDRWVMRIKIGEQNEKA